MAHDRISPQTETTILDVDGVKSVGHGDNNTIIIGVEDQTAADRVRKQFGEGVEGFNVRVRVTGRFEPLLPGRGSLRRGGGHVTPVASRTGSGTASSGGGFPTLQPTQPLVASRTQRFRPIPMGVSVGHELATAGTIGHFLTDGDGVFLASNNHVLAMVNQASAGDTILQPGPYDGGTSTDAVGELADFVELEDGATVDLAWATLTGAKEQNKALDVGEPGGDVVEPSPGDTLVKSGRTTAVTQGEVEQIGASVTVDYGVGEFTIRDQVITKNAMMEPGDSGSPGYMRRDGALKPAGLGFAGSTSASVFNTAANVQRESGLRILAPDEIGPLLTSGVGALGYGVGAGILSRELIELLL